MIKVILVAVKGERLSVSEGKKEIGNVVNQKGISNIYQFPASPTVYLRNPKIAEPL